MRKELKVVKHKNGLIEFRVDNRHVRFLDRTYEQDISFTNARQQAYEYVWARPTYMWTIKGVVA